MRQDRLDALWAQHGRVVEALSGLMHLRISSLPHVERESLLTLRQREVLECISVGRTTQEIAGILEVAPATVEKHLRLARKALGAKTTAQAILLAASRKQIFNSTAEPRHVSQDGTFHPERKSRSQPGAPGLPICCAH
ncbi:helix-turn-helix transcriptional regulator [Paracoccus sp. PXZ]